MRLLYSALIYLFDIGLFVYGLFNRRINQWNYERKSHLKNLIPIKITAGERKIIWMHCASLGEYEQGLPLIRALKERDKNYFFLLSFFSPSGFEQRKNDKEVDVVIYLPMDTLSNAKKIVSIINPILFIGVKYEFWWNLLRTLKLNNVKVIFISVLVNSDFYFLKKQLPFRKWLQDIDTIFTQDEISTSLLQNTNHPRVFLAGDTRTLSVAQRLEKINAVPIVKNILPNNMPVIIYGSIYKSDLPIICSSLKNKNYFHIIVPHDVSQENINSIKNKLDLNVELFTELKDNSFYLDGIIINTMGMLFDLYQYAAIVYIGGGFERFIHNTLEPAVFGLHIAFGPKHSVFVEAKIFIEKGIAMEVINESQFEKFIKENEDQDSREMIKLKSKKYFESNVGSIQCIMNNVFEK